MDREQANEIMEKYYDKEYIRIRTLLQAIKIKYPFLFGSVARGDYNE